MALIKHEISLRPHLWQQRFFWSKARFVGIIAGIRGGNTIIDSLAFLQGRRWRRSSTDRMTSLNHAGHHPRPEMTGQGKGRGQLRGRDARAHRTAPLVPPLHMSPAVLYGAPSSCYVILRPQM
jgi:hypothetical protein